MNVLDFLMQSYRQYNSYLNFIVELYNRVTSFSLNFCFQINQSVDSVYYYALRRGTVTKSKVVSQRPSRLTKVVYNYKSTRRIIRKCEYLIIYYDSGINIIKSNQSKSLPQSQFYTLDLSYFCT